MRNRNHMMFALLLPLAACGSEAPAPVAADKGPPAIFPAGNYEVSALAETLKAADQFTPATKHKVGQTEVRTICSPAGDKPAVALFSDTGDTCTATSDYAKNGRINMSYNCQRPGQGLVTLTFDGKYDEQSFEVAVATGTYFSGQGDYVLTQRIKGKRLGDCAAPAKAG
ncbi:DUF3617 family protein [Sphingomonas sp.]|uniref:DUF3617 domain-containing protein n=1 Tax=Sphingomonas sp. TaxID=28214 RepID=UPI00286BA03E|nr:DUF3617 family protein [Sphingomonas sp.]